MNREDRSVLRLNNSLLFVTKSFLAYMKFFLLQKNSINLSNVFKKCIKTQNSVLSFDVYSWPTQLHELVYVLTLKKSHQINLS